jgi:DNA-binding transcriptional regulator YiaG
MMTPAQVRAHRQALGMTQAELAAALRLAKDGKRTVRHWETEGGKFQISGPASVALELMVAGMKDDDDGTRPVYFVG